MEEEVEDRNALEFLQGIYKNPMVALPVRMRAAIEALPFEVPKLTAVAHLCEGETFAARLEKAIEKSNGARLIEARVINADDNG